ncbi:MAG TPA: hypothetical protein VFS24_19605, partial [Steroidobacteraceae bacterium]|nr:hypothetical protein [Steroidobacteraceae bacterium]
MEWVIDGQRLLINVGQSMVSCTPGRTRTCNEVAFSRYVLAITDAASFDQLQIAISGRHALSGKSQPQRF